MDKKYPDYPRLTEKEDPEMNGGYINPPRIKRQFRDPHADWWDKQERRNYGEPVHEDHDTLGMFSLYEYTWVTPGKAWLQIGTFVAVFLSVCYVSKLTYQDRVSYPREFEGGLEKELGGRGAVRARMAACALLYVLGAAGEPRVPLQEFRVNCHLAPESLLIQTPFPVDTPIMTCFVPSLPVGAPFHISISSWKAPEASHHTLTTYGMPDLVRFEVTVLFDGVPVASNRYEHQNNWPHVVTAQRTPSGQFLPLGFPVSRPDLLSLPYWNAADDVGRIKIIISEGIPGIMGTQSFHRTKNIVAFSYQHLDMQTLQQNGIAWPSSFMHPGVIPMQEMLTGANPYAPTPQRLLLLLTQLNTHTPEHEHSLDLPTLNGKFLPAWSTASSSPGCTNPDSSLDSPSPPPTITTADADNDDDDNDDNDNYYNEAAAASNTGPSPKHPDMSDRSFNAKRVKKKIGPVRPVPNNGPARKPFDARFGNQYNSIAAETAVAQWRTCCPVLIDGTCRLASVDDNLEEYFQSTLQALLRKYAVQMSLDEKSTAPNGIETDLMDDPHNVALDM
ncbi:hypothetical protein P8C59_006955 [Phyllachora maydis]|uniref:Uncharacterized protein n=1 Tax=Phyllachora maydis TaxID=1825666 RepID=A0AAD9I7W2_9PEZI|nr:hypothetical protein P8C59_006955 [Phyllachora maydis]